MILNKTDRLFTNSCIQLSIPFEYQQYGAITCYWTSVPTYPSKPGDLLQFLTLKQRTLKDNQRTYYLCSPLDIGCTISVKVEQEKLKQKTLLDSFKYGMVYAEQNLIQQVQNQNYSKVQILLNKNTKKQGNVRILQQHKERNNNSIIISVTVGNMELKFPLNQQIAKIQMESFQKYPYFKIYDSEPNTVGLLICSSMPYLMDKLRELNIFYHFGNYLKLYFKNRACRDFFILSVISLADNNIQTLKPYRKSFFHLQNQKRKDGCHTTQCEVTEQKNMQNRELLKIPKIQSTIRASQIINSELMSASGGQNKQQIIQEDILEDIYNILYTPANKIGIQSDNLRTNEKLNNMGTNAQNIISMNNNLNLASFGKRAEEGAEQNSIQIYQSQQINGDKNIEKTEQENNLYIFQDKNQFSPRTDGKSPKLCSMKDLEGSLKNPIKRYKTLEYEPEQSKSNKKQSQTAAKPNLQSKIGIQRNNIFSQQMREIDLLSKINQLLRKNESLIAENNRLKIENERLRSSLPNNIKAKQLNRMIQIKEMAQLMACKLQQLSKSNNLSVQNIKDQRLKSPQQIKMGRLQVKDDRKQKKCSNRKLQQSKRMWSPRTHHQIMKSIRQKHPEDRNMNVANRVKKQREKSLSKEEEKHQKGSKCNLGSLNECLTFGKSNGYVFHFQEQQQQNLKSDLCQTTELGQNSKKLKDCLFSSARNLREEAYKFGQKRHIQPEENVLQPTFRNVFG